MCFTLRSKYIFFKMGIYFMSLFQLELLRQRRDFSLSTVIPLVLFLGYLLFVLHWFVEIHNVRLQDIFGVSQIIIGYGVFDIILKFIFQRSRIEMPSYVRLSPISVISKNSFEVVNALIDFWNVLPLVFFIPFLMLFDGISYIIFVSLLLLTLSLTNCFVLRLCRKVGGLLVYSVALLVICYYGSVFYFYNELHLSEKVLLLIQISFLFLSIYLSIRVKCYEVKTTFTNMNKISLFSRMSLDFLFISRLKRIRTQYLIVIYMIVCFYQGEVETRFFLEMFFLFIVFLSVSMVGQFNFSLEANFWSIVETSPNLMKTMFEKKFRFYFFLTLIVAMICIPSYVSHDLSILFFVSSFLIISVFYNISLLLNFLFVNRLDMWSSPFFNYQGSSLFTIICQLLPIGLIFATVMLFELFDCQTLGCIVFIIISTLTYVFKNKIFDIYYRLYRRNRYSIMERFSK